MAEKLRKIATSLRVGHELPLLPIGNMRREATMKSIKVFSDAPARPGANNRYMRWTAPDLHRRLARLLLGAAVAASLLALVAALALSAPPGRAAAQEGGLTGALATGGGFSLVVWGGGHADEVLSAAHSAGCEVRSFWANRPGGGLVGYFPTPIAIVNQDFLVAYPDGVLGAGNPVIVVCAAGGAGGAGGHVQPVSLTPVFGGRTFDRPIELLSYPGGRWLVAEQGGRVLLLESNGADAGTLLNRLVSRDGNEEGLLSVALDPDFPARPYLYAYYSAPSGQRRTVLSRYTVANDVAVPSSELILLEVPQPFSNHNGGAIRFGPDGMLYLGLGDGGSGGDPQGYGQDRSTLLGSVIRIDVSTAQPGAPYAIPATNPFLGVAGARAEIWAFGLRNPWRMAFDPASGDLWLGDVGQGDVEEVDVIERGGNYGWNRLEGRDCFEPPSGCSSAGTVLPVASYRHGQGCAITGGVVYRGTAIPQLQGHYIYGDVCSGRIWALPVAGGSPVQIAVSGDSISSFGTGPDGAVYVVTFGGGILRIDR